MSFSINFPTYGTITVALSTVANLRTYPASDLLDNLHAIVDGQNTISDGLGGLFRWDGGNTTTDDGVNVIAVTGVTIGRWIKTVRSIVGATGATGATGPTGPTGDVTPAATAAKAAAEAARDTAAASASAANISASNANTSASNAATSAASAATSAAASPSIVKGRGRKNLFRDPFWRSTRLPTSAAAMIATDETIYDSGAGWVARPATGNNPYSDVYELFCASTGSGKQHSITLPRMGLNPGDQFAMAWEIASAGSITMYWQYRGRSVGYVGTNIVVASAVAGSTSGKVFKTPDMTVPADAFSADISIYCSTDFVIRARWAHTGTAAQLPDSPVDGLAIPDGYNRVAAIETQTVAGNNLVLKSVAFDSRTVAAAGTPTNSAFNPYNGFGVILNSASIPTGFNAVEIPGGLVWEPGYNPPQTIYAVLRATSGATVPFIDGALIGIGSITVDPASGSISQPAILLRNPLTGEVLDSSTILSKIGDHVGVGIYGINALGRPAERVYGNIGSTAFASTASAYTGYWRTTGFGDTEVWSQTAGDGSVALSLVNLVNPREVFVTPSATFAAAIAKSVDEAPSLIACPQKAYGIVGKETFLYWSPMLHRDWRRTNWSTSFSTGIPTGSGQKTEGWLYTPTSAGTTTLTINASRGDILSDTKTISFVTCAASAGAGTKRLLMMGDSLVEGGAGQAQITALSAADGVTNVINVGTKGTGVNKAEGYSGQSLTAFLSAQIYSGSGLIANPFYNPSTSAFDFAYYVTNSLAGTPPTHVLLEGGFWEVSHGASDSQAAVGASTWAATCETIIASIASYNTANGTSIKTAVWTQPQQDNDLWNGDGQDGQDPGSIGAAAAQLKRNDRVLAAKAISQFSGREASKVYVVPAGTCMDADTAYSRYPFRPKNAAVAARVTTTYATYTAMLADLTPYDETVVYVTDIDRYFIKVGTTAKGFWRTPDERDGFVRRVIDGIHLGFGWRQLAQQIFAWIKNNP